MEKWRRVWRDGIAPQLSTAGLQALATALVEDDVRLEQNTVCHPFGRECKVESACAIGFCAWQGDGVADVGSVLDKFHDVIKNSLQKIGRSECDFIRWFDDCARDEMRLELLGEVQLALKERT